MSDRDDLLAEALAGLDVGALRRDLRAWYQARGRSLPWREAPGVYGVWVSEIMLQQTTVAAVAPRWTEFLARFPDVRALAAATEAEVLEAWRGLGYYRRARLLHRAARLVVAERGGRLPEDAAGWRSLPGVGDYTAGAVASIGLGLPEPAVDTNVDRVLRRLVSDSPAAAAALKPALVRALAAALVDPADPGAWTQALMDLGSGPCRAERPDCGDCPFAGACRARGAGVAAAVPPRPVRADTVPVALSLLVARDADGLVVRAPGAEPVLRPLGCGEEARSSYGGLYRGYWRLPSSAWYRADDTAAIEALAGRFAAAWAGWLGASLRSVRPLGSFRGAVTRYRQTVLVFDAERRGRWPAAAGAARARPDDPARPLAQPDRRALALAAEPQRRSTTI